MAKSISAGLLMYSQRDLLHVLLAHPGGPYFANKDDGAWSIPKGLASDGEAPLLTAKREFTEETGYELDDDSRFLSIGSVTLKSGKEVHAWAVRGEWETGRRPTSNTFEIEWSPRSGRKQAFPEIDRAEMFSIEDARRKINSRQQPFLDRLEHLLQANDD